MPLPAASDTMMVTGRLGYWACAGEVSAKPSAKTTDIANRRITHLSCCHLGCAARRDPGSMYHGPANESEFADIWIPALAEPVIGPASRGPAGSAGMTTAT